MAITADHIKFIKEMMWPKSRSQRVINKLRRKYPGKWRHDPKTGRWHHQEGWHVYAAVSIHSDCAAEAGYYRSDSGERVEV